jgi:sarcosine oxidase gamma subunit
MAMNGNRSDMYNPSDKINMLAFILTGGVAPLTLWFAPLLVGSYIEVLGFSERNAVLLLSGEMAGYALAGAVAFQLAVYRIGRVSRAHLQQYFCCVG